MSRALTIASIAVYYAPAHYVLFPDRSDRYFAPVYLLSLAAIAYAFAPRPVATADQIPK